MTVHLSAYDESMSLPGGVHRVHWYCAVNCGGVSEALEAGTMGRRVHCVNGYDHVVLLQWGGNNPLALAPLSSMQITVDGGCSVKVEAVE